MARRAKPRAYHHGDLREALVAAGRDIVECHGIAAFTLRECARRAGVSHAAPKNHFASVGDLTAEIAARGFEEFHTALDRAAAFEPSPEARLLAMGRAYVSFARANPGVYGLMFRHGLAANRTPHLAAAGGAAWAQLFAAVSAIIGEGRADAAAKAAHVWALVHGIASLAIDRRLPPAVTVDALMAVALPTLPTALKAVGENDALRHNPAEETS